jgi:hypothetical protein
MTAHPHQDVDQTETGQERSAWVKPAVSSLRAGDAELGDVTNPDGNVFS